MKHFKNPIKKDTESGVIALAERVIVKANRENPADAVLRIQCKDSKSPPALKQELAQAVFVYYRWFGALNKGEPLSSQIQHAAKLAELFERNPDSFSEAELTRSAVPEWLGNVMEVSQSWLKAIQDEPRLWLRMRATNEAETLAALAHAAPGKLPHSFVYQGEEDLFSTQLFHGGNFEIQDIASQAVGWLCAPQPGSTWWDACAGEGGKTMHLSDLMENRGLIWASDRAEWRLKNLKRRAGRAKCFNYRAALWNGGEVLPTKTKFDGVLVDAPCSGVGTWQRNPHARWTTELNDVTELAQLQQQLLSNAAKAVKPGGKLVYSVCTLTRPETLGVVEQFEAAHPEFVALKLATPFREHAEAVHPLWLWPHETKGNGMFVAAWQRK